MDFRGYRNKVKNGTKTLLKGGFFHILTGNFLNKAISMISSIVIARVIDKSVYASISYADNLYSYLSLVAGLGMSSALLKFCSTDQRKSLDKAYFNFAMKIGGVVQFIGSIGICFLVMFWDIPYSSARIFTWSLLLYPLLDLVTATISIYMRTQLENKMYAAVGVIKSVALCVISIVLILAIGTAGVIPARYISLVIVLIYSWRYYKRTLSGIEPDRLTHKQKKAFVYMALSLCVANFFSGIMPINETFLVNNLIRDEIITANFRVAGLLPQLLLLVSGAVTVYYFPIVARLKDKRIIKKKVVEIAIVNAVVIILLTVLGMIFTPLAIYILYGSKYMDAVSISYLLWIMRASNCVIRLVPINMLPAIGKTGFNLYMSIISCVMQCVIDYFCIKNFGIRGVAVGAIVVYIVTGILYWVYFLYCCKEKEVKVNKND